MEKQVTLTSEVSINENVKTYMALTLAVLFWGMSFVGTKVALESIPTFSLVFFRFLIAFVILLALTPRFGLPTFSKKEHLRVFLIALFEPGLYFLFETAGLKYSSAPKVSLIIATIPIFVLIFATFFLGEKGRWIQVAGILLSLVGIGILIVFDSAFSFSMEGSLFGDVLVFGAVFSAVFYIVGTRTLGMQHSSFSITSMQSFYGALFFLPFFLYDLPRVEWAAISPRSFIALIYLTLFATIGAFLSYNYALTRIPASKAAVFINGIPVVTAFAAWFVLGEKLNAMQIMGAMLVLVAVYLSNYKPKLNVSDLN